MDICLIEGWRKGEKKGAVGGGDRGREGGMMISCLWTICPSQESLPLPMELYAHLYNIFSHYIFLTFCLFSRKCRVHVLFTFVTSASQFSYPSLNMNVSVVLHWEVCIFLFFLPPKCRLSEWTMKYIDSCSLTM